MNETKTLISYILITYNQEKYIEEAVKSAFAQTYSPLEIIISDDCSKDRTFAKIEELIRNYNGPHKIILNRNLKNMGIGEHLNKVLKMAKGKLFVMAAGDDIALANKTEVFYKHWSSNPNKILAMSAGYESIDNNGNHLGENKLPIQGLDIRPIEMILKKGYWNGCCVAISRELYDKFGGLNYNSADRTWYYRAAYLGGVYRIRDILLKYRLIGVSKRSLTLEEFIKKQRLLDNMCIGNALQMQDDLNKLPEVKIKCEQFANKQLYKYTLYSKLLFNKSSIFEKLLGFYRLVFIEKQKRRVLNSIIALMYLATKESPKLSKQMIIQKLLCSIFKKLNEF